MSVADRKGYLRRWKLLQRKGHTPKKTSLSLMESIEQGKAERKAQARRAAASRTAAIAAIHRT